MQAAAIAFSIAMALATPRVAAAQGAGTQVGPIVLKMTVTLSRYTGEKKTSSLPFVLMLVSGDERPTTVQMSSQVAIPQGGIPGNPFTSQNIGTSMSATAKLLEGGLCNLALTISDTQLVTESGASAPELKGLSRIQSFTSSPRLILRDGATVSYNAGTDKFTGEIVKVDVTMNIVK
jgi:hypothetical protein